MKNTIR